MSLWWWGSPFQPSLTISLDEVQDNPGHPKTTWGSVCGPQKQIKTPNLRRSKESQTLWKAHLPSSGRYGKSSLNRFHLWNPPLVITVALLMKIIRMFFATRMVSRIYWCYCRLLCVRAVCLDYFNYIFNQLVFSRLQVVFFPPKRGFQILGLKWVATAPVQRIRIRTSFIRLFYRCHPYFRDRPLSKWWVQGVWKPFITRQPYLGNLLAMLINHLQVMGWSSE